MKSDTIFRIASQDKVIATATTAIPQTDGLILVRDPVSTSIPTLANTTVTIPDEDGWNGQGRVVGDLRK